MDNLQDIDMSNEAAHKQRHSNAVNLVFAVAAVFIFVFLLESIDTGAGFKTLIGSTVIVAFIFLAYWAGRRDEKRHVICTVLPNVIAKAFVAGIEAQSQTQQVKK